METSRYQYVQRLALAPLFYFDSAYLASQIQTYKSVKTKNSRKCIETLTESFGYMSKRIKTITKTKNDFILICGKRFIFII